MALPASEEEEEEDDDGGGAAADGATPAAPRAGLSAEQLAERDLSRIIGRLFVPKVAPPAAKKAHEYHYRLNVAIKREIEAQPPKFQHISANRCGETRNRRGAWGRGRRDEMPRRPGFSRGPRARDAPHRHPERAAVCCFVFVCGHARIVPCPSDRGTGSSFSVRVRSA